MSDAREGADPQVAPPSPPPSNATAPSRRGPQEQVHHETSSWPVLAAVGVGIAALLVFGHWAWVVVILGVLVMITLHELGHFVTAKWAGMKCTEFFLGFGPRLWSFRRGETEYGIKAVPAGAYVRIIGMNNLDEVPPEDEARTYRQQSFPKRLIVVLGGPASHFVQAFVILFVMLAIIGVPRDSRLIDGEPVPEDWYISGVTSDSAAAGAGLESGDKVVAWNGEPVETFPQLQREIRASEVGEEVTLTIERDGRTFQRTTEIGARPDDAAGGEAGEPFLGVGHTFPDYPASERLNVVESIGQSLKEVAVVTKDSMVGLASFFSPTGLGDYADTVAEGGRSSDPGSSGSGGSSQTDDGSNENRVLSIYGAVRLGAELGEDGAYGLLSFFLIINLFVAIINLIPLLPFDGGHAAVAIYERIRSRQGQRYHADVTKLLPLAYAVVMGLVILGITSLYLDIVNPVEL